MNPRTKNLLIAAGLCLLVVGFGALDDWFGDSLYGADGIAYFDDANAILHGDWATALNPYWSIGYPLILAAARGFFPTGWAGEWTSIHVVDLVIFIATFVSFLHFLHTALTYAAKASGTDKETTNPTALYVVGTLIFLEWQVQIKNVSRTTPDLMISGLFFVLMAAALQFCLRPNAKSAILMGLLAGLGYIAKAVFLPLSFLVFLVVGLRMLTQSRVPRIPTLARLMWGLPALALVAGPYVIAQSVVLGHFTLGEAGGLNYAWTVNGLTHWHWMGGPAALGEPLHPVRLLLASPHVYEYAEPIHLTYPPWSNPFYWYEGYHHFFSLKNQVEAIRPNLFTLTTTFFDTPHAPVKAVASLVLIIAIVVFFTNAKLFCQRLLALWPVWLPSLLGLCLYLIVTMDPRYIVGFVIVLILTPLLALFVPSALVGKKTGALILIAISLIGLTYLVIDTWPTIKRAKRNEPYTSSEQWRIGLYLTALGVPPGAKVAEVRVESGIGATWAYVSAVHLVAQIGNQDFTEDEQEKDFQLFMTKPAVQQTVFDLFRKSGAVLVVALAPPQAPQGDGWTQIPGTTAWYHPL